MQKTAYEMRISDWSSDVCSSDLGNNPQRGAAPAAGYKEGSVKKLAVALLFLLVAAVAALLVLPSFWDWNAEKGRMAALVKKHTGRDLEIAGDVRLRLLPTPTFELGRAHVCTPVNNAHLDSRLTLQT